jgi:hypothetical protein
LESRGFGFGRSGKGDDSQQRDELMYGKGGKDDGSQQHGARMHGKGGADAGGIYSYLTEHPLAQSFSENKCTSSESVFGEIDKGRMAHY